MIGPWPPFQNEKQRRCIGANQVLEQRHVAEDVKARMSNYTLISPEPRVVFSSKLGRLFNLSPSRW